MKKLYIVGIGSGSYDHFTNQCNQALTDSQLICGYTVYVDLVKPHFPEKEYLQTGMTKEIERCKLALEHALTQTVAMVCSGDSSIYGMTSLILQIQAKSTEFQDVDIEIVPGITAAISGGAVLGSPLTNDFAVISLSDLLTPMEMIEKRLEGVGVGDFVAVIYNPASKKRSGHLKKACEILLKYKSPDTVCGWVRNIGRKGESYEILTLSELSNAKLDMFTTVFIGNSQTKLINGKMVTTRGYEKKSEDI